MRFILKNLLSLLLILLLISAYLLVTTEKGLNIILQSVSHFTSNKITVKKAQGKLYSHIILEGIIFKDAYQDIAIGSLDFAWDPSGLLVNKFLINHLHLKNANIIITQSNPTVSKSHFDLSHFFIKQLTLDHVSLLKDNAHVTFTGTYNKDWRGVWSVNIPDLSTFLPSLKGSLISSGKISGPLIAPVITANLDAKNILSHDQKIKSLKGKLLLNLTTNSHSTISLTGTDLTLNDHKIHQLTLETTGKVLRQGDELMASFKINIANKYPLQATLSFPHFTSLSDLSQPIHGKIIGSTTHLELLTDFFHNIKNPKGILHALIELKGSFAAPIIHSEWTLNKGSVRVPDLGISLEKISLTLQQQSLDQLHLKGSFQAGEGQGQVQGDIYPFSDQPMLLNVKGSDLGIVKLADYKIIASPDVKITWAHQTVQIEGDIVVPSADITPKSFGSTVTLPSEVVFVREPTRQIALPFNAAVKINLHLGNKIHVVYKDLETYLKGNLRIVYTPQSNAIATGELHTVRGTYNAYGQVLTILNGRLVYTGGALSNPGLNIRAGKQVKAVILGGQSSFDQTSPSKALMPIYEGTENLTVGLRLSGTFGHRDISLFSNPSGLNQNDILSYLTFGYPQSQISEQQNKLLINAAAALNMGGKQRLAGVTDKLQNTFGLKEMNVESTQVFDPVSGKTTSATSLVVGKQLLSNLYAHYSIGLFDPVSTLNLRYQVSKRFAIQSETSTIGNGADLLYSIERD